MVTTRLRRRFFGITLGLAVAAGSGCAVVKAATGGLAEEAGSGPTETSARPPSTGPAVDAPSDAPDARSSQGMTSVYLQSPALTWGELQLHRPHAITGSLWQPAIMGRQECAAVSLRPFEVTGAPRWSAARSVVQVEHVPFGVSWTAVPIGRAVSLDEEVMADRMLRSGASLVQRGPVCIESIFFHWTMGGGRSATAAHW